MELRQPELRRIKPAIEFYDVATDCVTHATNHYVFFAVQ